MKKKKTPWILAAVGLVAVAGLLAGIKALQIDALIKAGKSFVPPPESVASAEVKATEWEGSRGAVATLVAIRGVTLSSELGGLVRGIAFDSGSAVRRGALLVKLDVSAEEAQLASATADAALAKANLERARSLARGGANSQADLDGAEAREKQAVAAVANLKAVIGKKTILAPFDGRISIRQVELGQVLSPGTPIASLVALNPIHADFWLPQQALAELRVRERVRLRTDAFPGSIWNGEITTINPEVDSSTRNVRVRATFANDDGRLRPGMFANVEVRSSESRPVLIIPSTAVIFAPYGDSVYALREERDGAGKVSLVARQRFVRLGERRGDFVAVDSGLTARETIVSSGAFKLKNGVAVVVNNALAPTPELAPNPSDR